MGEGFFVLTGSGGAPGVIYDGNGNEFRMRGTNKTHWDLYWEGQLNINANATRWIVDFNRAPLDQNVKLLRGSDGMQGGTIASNNVVIPANWDGTCHDEVEYIRDITDIWVEQMDAWNHIEKWMILNIANEWGPGEDDVTWRNEYTASIAAIRAAGWNGCIMVDAGGCGQSHTSIINEGHTVFNSDPQKNVVFSQHVYGFYHDIVGGVTASFGSKDITEHFADLKATGLPVVIGEFGPGRNIGPSPTMMDPLRIIEVAEANGLGHLNWSWDDNNLEGSMADDDSFALSYDGTYTETSDLTIFGQAVVEDPTWGLLVLATTASIFPAGADDIDYGDGCLTVGDGNLPLDLSSGPNTCITEASVPAVMLTGSWKFTITPDNSSANYKANDTYDPLLGFGGDTGKAIFIGPGATANAMISVEGHGQTSDLTWSASQTITITVNVPAGTLTIAGATAGNGTYNIGLTSFATGPINIGNWAGGGGFFPGSIGDAVTP